MPKIPKKYRGFTLIETLVYIAMFTVFLTFSMRLFYTVGRVGQVSGNRMDRMTRYTDLNAAFRKTVREAAACIDQIPGFTSGPDTLILKSQTRRGRPGFIVLSARQTEGRFSLLETWEEAGVWRQSRPVTWPLKLTDLHFDYDAPPGKARCLSLCYRIAPDPGCEVTGRAQQDHIITAALRTRPCGAAPPEEGDTQ